MTILLLLLICLLIQYVYSVNLLTNKLPTSSSSSSSKISTAKYSWELDQNAMISKSTFKIKPAALIQKTKDVINNGIGLKNADDLADDFQFIFPVVGPLSKGSFSAHHNKT